MPCKGPDAGSRFLIVSPNADAESTEHDGRGGATPLVPLLLLLLWWLRLWRALLWVWERQWRRGRLLLWRRRWRDVAVLLVSSRGLHAMLMLAVCSWTVG